MILGTATATTDEDPFGPGDPLEVARLVRRALANAGRKAAEVRTLVVVSETDVIPDALDRFVRRALGPHGATIASSARPAAPGSSHEERVAIAADVCADARDGSAAIGVALGPDHAATAVCSRCPASDAIIW